MRFTTITILFIFQSTLIGQDLSIVSWNLKDFGKTRDDIEMHNIALEVRDADIICIQEVVAKDPGGAKAVARLSDELNRMGAKWDYRVTDPTGDISGGKRERYAYIWKTSKVKLKKQIRLLKELDTQVCREPALALFVYKGNELRILNYHACTHKKHFPERKEIASITYWLEKMDFQDIIWCGDMNLVIDDIAFKDAFDNGFKSVLNGEKTSLKTSCKNGNYLSRAEDNILYKLQSLKYSNFSILDFIASGDCNDVSWKRTSYSDHLGVEIKVGI